MLEPLVPGFIGWILSNAIIGHVANRGDAAAVSLCKYIAKQVNDAKIVNSDLQQAVYLSYVQALKIICEQSLNDLRRIKLEQLGNFKLLKTENWLLNEMEGLEKKLKLAKRNDYIEPPIEKLNEVESLITTGDIAGNRLQTVKSKLIETAIGTKEIPECYKKNVENLLFELMCGYFADEIEHNQAVHNLFEVQLLSKLDLDLESAQITVEHIEDCLRNVAKEVTQVVQTVKDEAENTRQHDSIEHHRTREKIELNMQQIRKDITDLCLVGVDQELKTIKEIHEKNSMDMHLKDFCRNNDEAIALQSYCTWLYSRCQFLKLQATNHRSSKIAQSKMNLSNVYVPLDTRERVATCEDTLGNVHRLLPKDIDNLGASIQCVGNWNLVPMSVVEAFNFYRHIVLLGGPGSGKSTAINFMTLCSAGAYIEDQACWIQKLKDWTHEVHLPILISLADFAHSESFGSTASAIWDFFEKKYKAVNNSIGPIKNSLANGKAIILLDDLDQVPFEKQSTVMSAVIDFSHLYSLCRYIITCREIDYKSKIECLLPGFRSVTLAPLVPEKIDMFIDAWYTELRNLNWDISDNTVDELKIAIHNSDLIQLADCPLLLTQMALLHSSYGKLPDDRVDLYSEVVRLLLGRWNVQSVYPKISSEHLSIDDNTLNIFEKALHEIAYLAISEGETDTHGIEKSHVISVMQRYLDGDVDKAKKFFDFAELTLGLITDIGNNMFDFPHRSFQEYMAAQYLHRQSSFISSGVDVARKNFSKWHNVFDMAVRLAGPDIGISAVRSMWSYEPPSNNTSIKVEDIDWYSIWMAAEALSELGTIQVEQRPERLEILDRIRRWLILLIESNALTIRERNDVGKLLSSLGEIRHGVTTMEPDLVKIPKGCVILGTDVITKGCSYRFDIPYDYFTSKYLVTNANYAIFLSENPTYPLPKDEGNIWNSISRHPNPQFLNHPVVGISWDDARFYCEWLTKKLDNLNILPIDYVVRLPTDAEWMKIYRGGEQLPDGTQNPYPTRLYPWGNHWIEGYGNVPEAKISLYQTTTVGIYPLGATPYGVLDACGNVLEWTSTSWGSFDTEEPGFLNNYNVFDGRESLEAEGLRIVRGGSWMFSEGSAKCACRLDPSNKFPDTGFRILVGPKNIFSAFSDNSII